ncbi:hypothetical protein ABZ478_31615 [Streptomyces sp. NPDC005706]|uniref:hypothetical protein n=1 Tax=Streptomyces sp. NPDC005706 TaxID=3157169 RepID=UPI003404B6F9
MEQLRYLGTDSASGKTAYVVAEPGGPLERLADMTALRTAAVVTALVGEILEAGNASDAELAVFVPTLYENLCGVTEVAARLLDSEE